MAAAIVLPRILRIGAGAFREAREVLQILGLESPLIVTDPFIRKSGLPRMLVESLRPLGETRIFSETVSDPTTSVVKAGLDCLGRGRHDCVIGLGGGSSIDTAKAIAMLAVHGGSMSDYKAPREMNSPGLPIIAIPTTAGTGSEATRFTIVTDEERDEKMLCIGLGYLPQAALVDYELTLTKPMRLTADTGVDSLTHAIEAYVSRRANPFADSFALSAMKSIWANLHKACFEPQNRQAREAMMLAATQAGIAFSNSSVGLVHGMSRPIGAKFHVPHGMSNAMLLPLVTEYSLSGATGRYTECAKAMGLVSCGASESDACDRLAAALEELNKTLQVPTPEAYGISREAWEESIPTMVEQAIASGSPANNPLIPSAEDIEKLYVKLWSGETARRRQ
ncbi:MAG TPA: iron-containing alcohol dehydrogenase [Chthoniobacterales bacterium]|jgi:alcohol dehydrogenase class IV|nr:iron-containing alcohol dehydrogenase [Chthoniobacterales bacterium]